MPSVVTPVVTIVDDDDAVRSGLGALIRSLGYTAKEFSSSEAYLATLAEDDTDCLILDMHMPGMKGLELHQTLIEMGFNTPVIYITAFPSEKVRNFALAAGAVAMLSKPCDGKVLIGQIEIALGLQA